MLANRHSYNIGNVLSNFLLNMPICLTIGGIDYKIISTLQRKRAKCSAPQSVIIDFAATASATGALSTAVGYMALLVVPGEFNIWQQALPMMLWNSIIVLLIELYFYNRRQIE